MSEQPTDVAPADFDLDAWIAGIKPLERSVEFTAAGDLVARGDDLLRRYERVKDVAPEHLGANDDNPDGLAAQMQQLREELAASRTVWYVKGLTEDEIDAARKAAEKAVKRSKNPEAKPDYTLHIIASAITRIVRSDGSQVSKVSPAQVKALVAKLGHGKVLDKLMETIAFAMSQEPSITAPFSQTSSPDLVGPELSPSSEPPETGESPTV